MKSIVVFLVVLFVSGSVNAAVVNFASVSGIGAMATTYNEGDVSAQSIGGDLAHQIGLAERVHLTDYGTSFASGISFVMSTRFDALSFDIRGFNNFCLDFSCQAPEAFNNVEVLGMRGGSVVATEIFYSGTTELNHVLGSGFSNLDKLSISVLLPLNLGASTCAFFAPCSFFDIDNLALRPVDIAQTPLPAGLPLYGAGMLLLGYGVRRYKKKSVQ